jgi:hypothetical protein
MSCRRRHGIVYLSALSPAYATVALQGTAEDDVYEHKDGTRRGGCVRLETNVSACGIDSKGSVHGEISRHFAALLNTRHIQSFRTHGQFSSPASLGVASVLDKPRNICIRK